MKKSFLCAAALWAASVTTGSAQPVSGISQAQDVDIRGFYIGMTAADVVQHAQNSLPNFRIEPSSRRHQGTKQEYTSIIRLQGRDEFYLFFFTGHYSGNQLYAIQREVKYRHGQEPSATETSQNILKKYGLPTLPLGSVRYSYVYDQDKIELVPTTQLAEFVAAEGSSSEFFRFVRDQNNGTIPTAYLNAEKCLKLVPKVQEPQFFNPTQASGTLPAHCGAGFDIHLRRSGQLLGMMTMKLSDLQLVMTAAAIDQAQDRALTKEPEPTGAAPKL